MSPSILDPLARIVQRIGDTELQVNIHRQILDPQSPEYRPELARHLLAGHEQGAWVLVAHEYFTETELFEYLASLDIAVLPYRFGTHSGWLEAALDVGTRVIVPDCGHYLDQHPSLRSYHWDGDEVLESSLRTAIEEQLRRTHLPGMDSAQRKIQRQALAETHLRIYSTLLRSTVR